jgi:hypothetical protein
MHLAELSPRSEDAEDSGQHRGSLQVLR